VIIISSSTNYAEAFFFSIDDLRFSSESEAVGFFASKKFEGIMVRPHFERQVAYLYLNRSKYPNRTWEEWKQVVSDETTKNPIKR
jgi:hypothetical protein